jgi:hypothetical protein
VLHAQLLFQTLRAVLGLGLACLGNVELLLKLLNLGSGCGVVGL